jgi:hypothetical protein
MGVGGKKRREMRGINTNGNLLTEPVVHSSQANIQPNLTPNSADDTKVPKRCFNLHQFPILMATMKLEDEELTRSSTRIKLTCFTEYNIYEKSIYWGPFKLTRGMPPSHFADSGHASGWPLTRHGTRCATEYYINVIFLLF